MLITLASLMLTGAMQPAPEPAAQPAAAAEVAPMAQPAPAAPAAPVAEAAPAAPLPSLPTSGDGAVILQVLEKVCIPAVRGQGVDAVAPSMGMKKNKRDNSWSMGLGGDKAYMVIIQSQGSNKDVCQAEVRYALGQEKPIVDALNIWSFLHNPELKLQANYVNVDPDGIKRVRKSWEHYDNSTSTAVNFSTMRKPNDAPLNAKYDTGMLFYQERKF